MSVIGDIYISDSYFRQLFEFVIIATVIYRSYVVTPLPRNNKYLKDYLYNSQVISQLESHTLEVTSGW
jgi:hypothetical protein